MEEEWLSASPCSQGILPLLPHRWQCPASFLLLPKPPLSWTLLNAEENWSLRTCIMLLVGSRPKFFHFLLDGFPPPQQLNVSRRCHFKWTDCRTPEIAEHHQFSRWMTRGTKSDESFLPGQEMIDLNNCLRIFTWHLNTVAVMITNVSLPHSKSIIGRSVSDNLYSNKIFTLSQFWIVANISWDSHFIIQGSFHKLLAHLLMLTATEFLHFPVFFIHCH